MKSKIMNFFSFTKQKGLTLFVTVGSTSFDKLIETMISDEVLAKLAQANVTNLILQVGNCRNESLLEKLNLSSSNESSEPTLTLSTISPIKSESATSPKRAKHELHIETYTFKDSIESDIERADVIISHAGAGTCLEVLRKGKRLLVVANDDLMDKHQSELADELQDMNCAIKTSIVSRRNKNHIDESFLEALALICDKSSEFAQFPSPRPELFESIVDKALVHV